MKTKNIFKSLAMAMLLPAMLLTTACSNDDFTANNDNNVTTAKQGYTLPVTVNVTREGDATMRATYNESTHKLGFSSGDKLLVKGRDNGFNQFAGILTWQSGGTFSGTITTENTSYTGTADDLLKNASMVRAILLPAGYDSKGFIKVSGSGYLMDITYDWTKAFALTKAEAVEQLSREYADSYSSGTGFALAPLGFILNFTITGLTPSTEVAVAFTKGTTTTSGNVTTDGSGNATFAISVNSTSIGSCTLTVGGNNIALPSTTLEAGHVYNITRSAAPAYTMAANATAGDHGKVVCAAGHLHDAKTAVPTGCTAVGILGKVTETGHGLILALQDATQQSWNTINGWTSMTTYAGTTLKVLPDDAARGSLTSYTTLGSTTVSNWCVAQKSDYEAIFTNLGSTTGDPKSFDNNVNAYITTGVGGTAMSAYYWSASLDGDGNGWSFWDPYWNGGITGNPRNLRPVLGF